MISKSVTLQDLINKIEILTGAVLSNKTVLSSEECAAYIGVSLTHIYKLTSTQGIPHYKPRGKMVYFDRSEIDEWLLQNRIKPITETTAQAVQHVARVS